MAVTSLAYWFLSSNFKRKIKSIFLTFIIAVAWELSEEIEERIIPNLPHLLDYFFWDGVFDIIFMVVGGIVILIIFDLLKIN
jgi:hypothetical protein